MEEYVAPRRQDADPLICRIRAAITRNTESDFTIIALNRVTGDRVARILRMASAPRDHGIPDAILESLRRTGTATLAVHHPEAHLFLQSLEAGMAIERRNGPGSRASGPMN